MKLLNRKIICNKKFKAHKKLTPKLIGFSVDATLTASQLLISSLALSKKQWFKNCLYKNGVGQWNSDNWFDWEPKALLQTGKQCFKREIS